MAESGSLQYSTETYDEYDLILSTLLSSEPSKSVLI